tara:strand:+ start:436 stop:813 length:378 start_codon:yes stop_codon:yes gene_type:complete
MNNSVKVTIIDKTLPEIHQEGIEASKKAVDDFLKNWNQKTGGNEYNEPTYCGFAHVALPDIKLSTKVGKEFAKIGFSKNYCKGLRLNNPAKYSGQSMDCKEVGASAYAEVLNKYGYKAYMSSRAD